MNKDLKTEARVKKFLKKPRTLIELTEFVGKTRRTCHRILNSIRDQGYKVVREGGTTADKIYYQIFNK